MVFALFHWWWDATGLDRAQVILSLASVAISIGLGFVAWWLAQRQVDIAKRQMDMQEEQHQFFTKQMAAQVQLTVTMLTIDSHTYRLSLRNVGDKTVRDVFWVLTHHTDSFEKVSIKWNATGIKRERAILDGVETLVFRGFRGKPLYPQRGVHICTISVPATMAPREYMLRWQATCEDGVFPSAKETGSLTIEPPFGDDG